MAQPKKRLSKAPASRRRRRSGKLAVVGSAATNTGRVQPCLVCYKDQPLSSFPDVGSTGNHNHEQNTCRQCFNRYSVNQIESGEHEIKCAECAEHLTYDQVKAIISKTSLIKYNKIVTKACVESDPDFRYCLGEKCKSGQIHMGGIEQPLFNCVACKKQHCANCEVPWHEDETCDQYQARHDDAIVQTAVVLSKTSKSCPGGCGARIERNGGCPHMHCIKCDMEFCYNCLGDYRHLTTLGICHPPPQDADPADLVSEEIKSRQEERRARQDIRDEQDDDSEALILVTTQRCPKCTIPIEKEGGCDHMTCSNCRREFCYVCLAQYPPILRHDNRRHKKHCIYHPSHHDRQFPHIKTDSDEEMEDSEDERIASARAANDDTDSEEEPDDAEIGQMLFDTARAHAAATKRASAKRKKDAAALNRAAAHTTSRALRSNTLVVGNVERRIDRTRTRALDRAVRSRGTGNARR